MLFYLPLEQYRERYTNQLSAAVTGWLEKKWIQYGVEYQRVCPSTWKELDIGIKTGVALDPFRRSRFCMEQIDMFLDLMQEGKVQSGDTIYLDDFWTPGIESVRYCADVMGIKLHIFANLWAQSVDEFDFTYKMRRWMRWYERGNSYIYDGIFVANTMLKDLLVYANVCPEQKVHVVGHPFDSEEVMSRMPKVYQDFVKNKDYPFYLREDAVVWSSRWDVEKCPEFFLQVAEMVIYELPNTQFYICTSAPKLRSNDPQLLEMLEDSMNMFPENIFLKENLTKEQYYAILTKSKIQFNAADQDWISYTLLEASVAGCYPVYPYWRGFPETLQNQHEFMYQKDNVKAVVNHIISVLKGYNSDGETHGTLQDTSPWSHMGTERRKWIHERYDWTWLRMLSVMGLSDKPVEQLHREGHSGSSLVEKCELYNTGEDQRSDYS